MSQSDSSQQWWYQEAGQTKGPAPTEQIRSLVEGGTLPRSTQIIVVGGATWTTVAEQEEALGMSAPTPAPSSPPPPPPSQATSSAPPSEAMSSAPPSEATSSAPPSEATSSQWGAPSATAPPGPGPSSPPPTTTPAPVGYPPPPAAYPSAPPTGAGDTPLSSSGKRFGAYLLDGLLAGVTLFIGWLIWSIIIWKKGQTPAKSLLGMRVVDTNTGRAATRGTMALRELVYKGILGSITFGITTIVSAFMILGSTHEGIWDKIAKTVVVDDPEGRLVA